VFISVEEPQRVPDVAFPIVLFLHLMPANIAFRSTRDAIRCCRLSAPFTEQAVAQPIIRGGTRRKVDAS